MWDARRWIWDASLSLRPDAGVIGQMIQKRTLGTPYRHYSARERRRASQSQSSIVSCGVDGSARVACRPV
jgi:hypothetical protein